MQFCTENMQRIPVFITGNEFAVTKAFVLETPLPKKQTKY